MGTKVTKKKRQKFEGASRWQKSKSKIALWPLGPPCLFTRGCLRIRAVLSEKKAERHSSAQVAELVQSQVLTFSCLDPMNGEGWGRPNSPKESSSMIRGRLFCRRHQQPGQPNFRTRVLKAGSRCKSWSARRGGHSMAGALRLGDLHPHESQGHLTHTQAAVDQVFRKLFCGKLQHSVCCQSGESRRPHEQQGAAGDAGCSLTALIMMCKSTD